MKCLFEQTQPTVKLNHPWSSCICYWHTIVLTQTVNRIAVKKAFFCYHTVQAFRKLESCDHVVSNKFFCVAVLRKAASVTTNCVVQS